MNESELQRVYNYSIKHRVSKVYSMKAFVSIDNGLRCETHWNCFIKKDHKSYYFDSFGGQPHEFLLNQLPRPLTYHNYGTQDINSKLCSGYCLYFFYLIERINSYDFVLKMCFG